MILVGRFGSPFVRRVGITLRLYGIAHEHRPLSGAVPEERIELQKVNPLARVPALVTDDGEALVDSATILDYLDRLVGPEKALTPAGGPERTKVMALIGLAVGAVEKSIGAYYELGRRPADKVHKPWLDMLLEQSKDGFEAVENMAAAPWLTGERMTQADVSTVAFLDFAMQNRPADSSPLDCPKLTALAKRANEMPEFAETNPY